jgi:hypothetical protein
MRDDLQRAALREILEEARTIGEARKIASDALASLPFHEPRERRLDLPECPEQEDGECGVVAVGGEDDGWVAC